MIHIDGKDGGGQMLRTSLGLSALKQKPFKITDIRGLRTEPGLKRQHIAAVRTLQEITDADVEGLSLGSSELVFKPEALKEKFISMDIGTAGSTTLLFDTLLPLSEKINIEGVFTGGTDVKWSPTFAYLKHVKLPLLRKIGLNSSIDLEKTGYYPEGGGRFRFNIEKSARKPIKIENRGNLERIEVYSKASNNLGGADVSMRQASEAEKMLKQDFDNRIDTNFYYVDSQSTGSTLLIKAVYENSIAGFDVLGERGKSSEDVAREAVNKFKQFNSTDASVDKHMADQLMSLCVDRKLRLTSPNISNHMKTNLAVLRAFGASGKAEDGKIRTN